MLYIKTPGDEGLNMAGLQVAQLRSCKLEAFNVCTQNFYERLKNRMFLLCQAGLWIVLSAEKLSGDWFVIG